MDVARGESQSTMVVESSVDRRDKTVVRESALPDREVRIRNAFDGTALQRGFGELLKSEEIVLPRGLLCHVGHSECFDLSVIHF